MIFFHRHVSLAKHRCIAHIYISYSVTDVFRFVTLFAIFVIEGSAFGQLSGRLLYIQSDWKSHRLFCIHRLPAPCGRQEPGFFKRNHPTALSERLKFIFNNSPAIVEEYARLHGVPPAGQPIITKSIRFLPVVLGKPCH